MRGEIRAGEGVRAAGYLAAFLVLLVVVALGCRSRTSAPTEEPAVEAEAEAPPRPEEGAVQDGAVDDDADETTADTASSVGRFSWRFEPEFLDVYRDTRVRFRLERELPDGAEDAVPSEALEVRWDFGDGSPPGRGWNVQHVYRGGQSDQRVTVTVTLEGERVFEQRRTVPLERLPVVPRSEGVSIAPDLSIPPPPAPTPCDTTFRFVVISDSNGPYGSVAQGAHVAAAIRRIVTAIRPAFVIHNGDMIAGQRAGIDREQLGRMWEGYHEAVTRPLRQAGIPLVPIAGNHDADPRLPDRPVYVEEWRKPENRPAVTMLNDEHYPLMYTFIAHGAFFLVMDGATGRVEESQLRWMRRQLRDARIYTARYVLSHVPLHKFTDRHFGETRHGVTDPAGLRLSEELGALYESGLDKHFRVYNILLEHNVTMFFSAHYEVYYKGRYGALRVVSTGNIAGIRRALSGSSVPQGPSFVVVDMEEGHLKRVFAVRGPDYTERFDENELPDEVEVYRYDPTFTPGFAGGTLPAGIVSE